MLFRVAEKLHKGKAVSVQVMKGKGDTAPRILNLGTR